MGKLSDKLVGKKIVVVGGSAGIGFGAAQALLEAGAQVTIISSSEDRINEAVKQLGGGPNVNGKVADARDEEALTNTLRSLAPLDHVIFSSVDKIIRGPLAEADLGEAEHLFGVKFWGSVVVGKALAKYDIVKPGGSLTLTSGAAAWNPGKGAVLGGALNAGVINLTKGLGSTLAEKRIRVNTVVPGLVKTGLLEKLGYNKDAQQSVYDNATKTLSVGFVATPEDIAEAYLYAVRADYANGTVISIDGGSQL